MINVNTSSPTPPPLHHHPDAWVGLGGGEGATVSLSVEKRGTLEASPGAITAISEPG